jgi:hypothetical protein
MNLLLSIFWPVPELLEGTCFDVGFPVPFIAIGLAVILAIGAGIVLLIVAAVKYLARLRNKTKTDG